MSKKIRDYVKEQKSKKTIIQIDSVTGKAIKKYSSIKQAVKNTTVSCGANIRRVLKMKRATAGGSCWQLFNDWLLQIKKDGNRSFKKLIQDFDIRNNELFTSAEVVDYHTKRLSLVWERLESP